MRPAIRVEHLSKQYKLGQRESYGALRDTIARSVKAGMRRLRGLDRETAQDDARMLWALRDVTFDIGRGEIVGIVGRNGSGKSTLLKILSRITEPTSGRAEVEGQVGSLLEVGTGFHPELSGRENVFVNGAILGMKLKEIERKFDEIVAFAQVERFIDTPVKHYSSGMQMRLAFAVAAHLQPNILLVDEVLAVGDAEFQKRCLGKMKDVSLGGRTVILVSHQMGQIRRLCKTVIWLDRGTVKHIGEVGETIRLYEHALTSNDPEFATGSAFSGWELASGGHTLKQTLQPFTIRVGLTLKEPVTLGHLGVNVYDHNDAVVVGWAFEPVEFSAGSHTLDLTIPMLPIRPGSYRLLFTLFNRGSNLTGGRVVEQWGALPPLTLDVLPVGHPQDEWAGVLNVPATLTHAPSGTREVVGTVAGAMVVPR
jgi:ABC-type polysaccharide/polyol phosphate transport system ATPase subunit